MRRVALITVLFCLGYFALGGLASNRGWIDHSMYVSIGSAVGSLASVIGLLSFAFPRVNKSDIDELGVATLRRVAEAAEQLEQRQQDLHSTQARLSEAEARVEQLTQFQKEVEVLVRKASLSLLLRDQVQQAEQVVADVVSGNRELLSALERIGALTQQLRALNEDIDAHPQAAMIRQIMSSVQQRRVPKRSATPLDAVGEMVIQMISSYARILTGR